VPATPESVKSEYFQSGSSAALGQILTDPKGLTLYTFTNDKPGVSTCSGACLANWPAYLSDEAAPSGLPANVSVFKRADGKFQFAWKQLPLYYFANDKVAGDTNGQGVGGVWYVVTLK
jgi:predicted lipoprotein with Yx(FWY)xxD motif